MTSSTASIHLHAHDGDHVHEHENPSAEHTDYIWKLENVELRTVGVDVGSSTSQLVFSRVLLRRGAGAAQHRFVPAEREIIWRSPVIQTPYRADGLIDADLLHLFVDRSFEQAGIMASDVDTGAVVLTGEALRRANARRIADAIAADAGRFVCASAGHHQEARLAARGSGILDLVGQGSLMVDIGGGTTKFAMVDDGEVSASAAIDGGGRVVAWDKDRRVNRLDAAGQRAAQAAGVEVEIGTVISTEHELAIADVLARWIIDAALSEQLDPVTTSMLLTDPLPVPRRIARVGFAGGVAEFIYGREIMDFGDIGAALASRVRAAFGAIDDLEFAELPGGIRSTVIGSSQFSFQVSGSTVAIADGVTLPVRNLPVVPIDLSISEVIDPDVVVREMADEVRLPSDSAARCALAVTWSGEPTYSRLAALAIGLGRGAAGCGMDTLVVVCDADIGKTIGRLISTESEFTGNVVSLDGLDLRGIDYIDVGRRIGPSGTYPVTLKSLLF
jgi:ethanolamine utilization protein EutA